MKYDLEIKQENVNNNKESGAGTFEVKQPPGAFELLEMRWRNGDNFFELSGKMRYAAVVYQARLFGIVGQPDNNTSLSANGS